MSGSTLAEDPQGEGAYGALALFSMLSLDGSSPTLVEEPDSELEPNPFELMASDMLAIISDLRNSQHSIESKESADKGVEKGNSYDPDSESLQNLASTPASRVKRFWPFKGSLPLVKSTATLPSSDPASEQLTEAWRWLLDACLDTVNRAIAAQVILETAADVKNHKPPLFWLLYAGHRALQTLQEFVRSDGSSTPSLDKWNPHPLLHWCSEAKKLFEKHGLADDQPPASKELSEHSKGADNSTSPLLRLLPPGLVQHPSQGAPFCAASNFTSWAVNNITPLEEMSIGRLQELYLFRGKKAPFHHEFLVAGFGDDGREIESWMRIERSARTQGGSSGLPAGVESYGPLLGGVGARETISFSTSKATLSTNANELAKVILPAPTTLPIFIIAVGRQIQSTTNSNEKYQLFTTNCRWYSRRNFLNILQWCDIAKIPATALWKGTETSLERIQAKLEKERFGGSKLVDLRAKGLDYRNLIHLASSQSGGDSKRLSRAVLDPILESLMTTTLDPEERSVLIADLLTKRSHVVASEDLPQALEDAERAIKLMRDLPKNAFRRDEQLVWSLGALAHALLLDGRYEEAIPLLRESLELDDPRSHTFAMRLAELGVNHRFLGNMEEAIKALRQSAHLLGRMEGSDWTDTRLQRANILIILAQTFEGLDRDKEALPIRQEIVSMRRDLPGKDDDGDDLLTLALINLAKCAIPAEDYEAAQQASKEAIRRCRADTKNDHMLFMSLLLSSHASYALDDMKTAIQNITAAIDLRSTADDSDEDGATRSRGSLLMTRSKYFLQIGDAQHALADIEAAITVYEAARDHSPDDSRIVNKLWEMQFAAGNLLKRLDRADDALDAYRNAVNVRRPAVEADPEGPEQLVLELVLSLEGCATMLKELDRPNSAKFFAEETIYYLRLRNRSSVSSTNTSEALRMTLLRHTQYLSELGDEEEALALATEAAEISERLEADQLQVSALMHKMLQEVKNGYPERAIVTAEACFELCETRLSDRRDLRSLALTTYARALDEVGKHAEAAVKQEESISILREVADFTTLDAKTQLAQRLGKIAEYYQDAGIFDKALVSINEAVGRYRTLYEEGEAAGMEYTRSIARKASILFSLNRRKEAKIALDEEFEMLKIVLVSKSVDEILEQADARHSDAMIHTMNGKPADALDCARQHVLLTRLAWSFEPRYSKADDGKDEEEEKPKSVLETALFGLGMIATMNGYRMDAAEAMLEAFQLSQGLNLDLDGDIMQKLIADTTETELA